MQLLGLLVIALAIYSYVSSQKKAQICTEEVVATISRIDTYRVREHNPNTKSRYSTNHDAYIKYSYMGYPYETKLDHYTSAMNVGDTVNIFVNPSNPEETYHKSSSIAGTIILFVFGIFIIVAGFMA